VGATKAAETTTAAGATKAVGDRKVAEASEEKFGEMLRYPSGLQGS
jgi:hypothetical protein